MLWEIGAGVAAGWLIGRLFGWLTFHVPPRRKLAKTGDGLIAIAATFVSYGLTEMIHCYGFLAVFVTALTLPPTPTATTNSSATCTTSPNRSSGSR